MAATIEPVALMWHHGSGDAQVRGHAYASVGGDEVLIELLPHAPERTPAMLARLRRWTNARGMRPSVHWWQPGGPWYFDGDLGWVEHALEQRSLRLIGEAPAPLPESFLRRPFHALVDGALGDLPSLDWPAALNAAALCVAPRGIRTAKDGERIALSAARPGSKYAHAGQTWTAAVFVSNDSGATWRELQWELDQDSQTSCWPPETIDALRWSDSAIEVEWEDPWIDFEFGEQWLGIQRVDAEQWVVRTR